LQGAIVHRDPNGRGEQLIVKKEMAFQDCQLKGQNMTSTTSSVQLRKIWYIGPLTVLASILGVLIVRLVAVAILQPNPTPISLGWRMPIVFTFVLCAGAVLVFALVARFAKNPIRTYQIIAFIVLVLSFFPDVGFANSPMPGANWPNAIALMIMHVAAWAITVSMLSRLTVAESKQIE